MEEFEALLAIYDGDTDISITLSQLLEEEEEEGASMVTIVVGSLPFVGTLTVSLGLPHGYPITASPIIRGIEAAGMLPLQQSMIEDSLNEICHSLQGEECLFDVVAWLKELDSSFFEANWQQSALQDDVTQSLTSSSSSFPSNRPTEDDTLNDSLPAGWFQSSVLVDRKSVFQSFGCMIDSLDAMKNRLTEIRGQRKLLGATHPCMYAYRLGAHADCDDDGEHGAGKKLAFLLEQWEKRHPSSSSLKETTSTCCPTETNRGWLLVVTRWYGGVSLGPVRFKHIVTVATESLQGLHDGESVV